MPVAGLKHKGLGRAGEAFQDREKTGDGWSYGQTKPGKSGDRIQPIG